MAKIDELTAQVKQMEALLEAHGIRQPVDALPATERPDYIAHGSPEHAQFLGLVEAEKGDGMETISTFTSAGTGKIYRLEDELGAIRHYPGIDPEKAVRLILQQKINELETKPGVPDDAPPMFKPAAVYPS